MIVMREQYNAHLSSCLAHSLEDLARSRSGFESVGRLTWPAGLTSERRA